MLQAATLAILSNFMNKKIDAIIMLILLGNKNAKYTQKLPKNGWEKERK